jgi:hypothetical protein
MGIAQRMHQEASLPWLHFSLVPTQQPAKAGPSRKDLIEIAQAKGVDVVTKLLEHWISPYNFFKVVRHLVKVERCCIHQFIRQLTVERDLEGLIRRVSLHYKR